MANMSRSGAGIVQQDTGREGKKGRGGQIRIICSWLVRCWGSAASVRYRRRALPCPVYYYYYFIAGCQPIEGDGTVCWWCSSQYSKQVKPLLQNNILWTMELFMGITGELTYNGIQANMPNYYACVMGVILMRLLSGLSSSGSALIPETFPFCVVAFWLFFWTDWMNYAFYLHISCDTRKFYV